MYTIINNKHALHFCVISMYIVNFKGNVRISPEIFSVSLMI